MSDWQEVVNACDHDSRVARAVIAHGTSRRRRSKIGYVYAVLQIRHWSVQRNGAGRVPTPMSGEWSTSGWTIFPDVDVPDLESLAANHRTDESTSFCFLEEVT